MLPRSSRREYNDRYYQKNREKILAKLKVKYYSDQKIREVKRRWAQKNAKIINARVRERYRADPQAVLLKNRKFRYGTDGQELLRKQNFACAICSTPFDENKPKSRHFDHDHKTKKARAWLCSSCNATIGFAKEDVSRLISAAIYLMKHS